MPQDSQNGPTSPRIDERLAHFRGPLAVLFSLLVLTALIVLARGEQGYTPASVSVVTGEGPSEETIYHWFAPRPEGVGMLEWRLPDERIKALSSAPLAIELSGPFSAQVAVNGETIGMKGRPGDDKSSEIAGPIDAVFAIPERALRETGNVAMIEYSAHHLNYRPAFLIHGLRLAPYESDARRPLRFYGTTVLSMGALAGLALAFWRFSSRRERYVVLLAVGCLGLLVSAGAEISRSFINYPYPWHAPRQALSGAGIVGFCLSFGAFVIFRWPLTRRLLLTAALAAGFCVLGPVFFSDGFDAGTSIAAFSVSVLTVLWLVAAGFAGDRQALAFAALPITISVAALLTPGRFIDHQAAVLAVAILGYFLLAWPGLLVPEPPLDEDEDEEAELGAERFVVKGGGKTVYVPLESIVWLKAVGNYTEIHLGNGEAYFDQRGLGALLEELSDELFRVHKSHAVRLSEINSLKSLGGSRYSVELSTGEELPVGRSRVDDLRAVLG